MSRKGLTLKAGKLLHTPAPSSQTWGQFVSGVELVSFGGNLKQLGDGGETEPQNSLTSLKARLRTSLGHWSTGPSRDHGGLSALVCETIPQHTTTRTPQAPSQISSQRGEAWVVRGAAAAVYTDDLRK